MQISFVRRFFSIASITFASFVMASALSSMAEAKELFGRMGLGYNSQFAHTDGVNGVTGISLKYGIAPRAMVELIAGFYSGSHSNGVGALKYMQTIHPESYANFYFLLGGGYVNFQGKSGSEFLAGLGAEFFIPGLESIGISFETGMSTENLTSNHFVLKTFGVSFLNAGMHFYF